MKLSLIVLLFLAACSAPPAPRQAVSSGRAEAPADTTRTPCTNCAAWNVPHAAMPVYGNTYYVGTNGLSAILITSPEGHVLIDGALRESAPLIEANVEALGFQMEDVALILNSHAHFDHAGGIAALQQASGATVAASPASAVVLEAGVQGPDDPQYAELLPISMTPVRGVRRITGGEIVRVGNLALTAHATPGHTAGGTTWTWTSCEDGRCLRMIYADSLTPVSEDGYRFSESERYPSILTDFARSFGLVEALPCDVLLSPHPEASDLLQRLEARQTEGAEALVDPAACSRYVATARERLARRLESERQGR